MDRSIRTGSILVLMACTLLLGGESVFTASWADERPESITFTFAPPEITYTKTLRIAYEGLRRGPKDIDSTARVAIRKAADGYVQTVTPIAKSEAARQRGLDVELTYLIDGKGGLKEVQGFEKSAESIKSKVPRFLVSLFKTMYDEKEMIERLKDEEQRQWEQRIGLLAGRTLKMGDVLKATSVYVAPEGEKIPLYLAYKILGRENWDGRDLVRLEYAFSTDPGRLSDYAGEAATGAWQVKPNPTSIAVSGREERLVDPDTMLYYHETREQETRTSRGATVQKVTTTYEYPG